MVKRDASRRFTLGGELIRKVLHVSTGTAISLFYALCGKDLLIYGLILCLSALCFLELLRLRGLLTVPLLRDRETKRIGGHIFFIIGSLLAALLFCKPIAIASILMLSIGDTAAALAQSLKRGVFYGNVGFGGRIKPPRVLVTMFCASFFVGYAIVGSPGIAAAGAVGAMIADGVLLRIYGLAIDDNLTVPLFAGFLMTLAS